MTPPSPHRRRSRVYATSLMAAVVLALWAPLASAQSIYTCIDAQGRRLTSDRPILACIDREQRELNRSGTLKRVVEPTQTAAEREAREARERQAELDRQRARNAIRRDQALITRYPTKAAHDADRQEALAQTQTVVDAAEVRLAQLAAERKTLSDEMEFYKKDPSRAPARLRRAIEANAEAQAAQRRAIDGQQDERQRINARYDEDLDRLKTLWSAQAATAGASATRR